MATDTKLNCKKGTQCGEACIERTDRCWKVVGESASAASEKFSSIIASTELKQRAAEAEQFISKEAKAEYRAKIKGNPNEKKLKKERLAAENEAWVFLRLHRERERLIKKGESPEEAERIRETLSKILQGDSQVLAAAENELRAKIESKRAAKKITKVSPEAAQKIEEKVEKIERKAATAQKTYSNLDKLGISTIDSNKEPLEVIKEVKEQRSRIAAEYKEARKQGRSTKELETKYNSSERMASAISAFEDKYAYREKLTTNPDWQTALESINESIEAFAEYSLTEDVDAFFKSKTADAKATRALYGEPTEDIEPVGDPSLRGKVESPPLPSYIDGGPSDVHESFRNFLEESVVAIQVSPQALQGILAAGHVKNMFEKGAKGSIGEGNNAYEEARKSAEMEIFGISNTEKNASERPVYGYVESKHYIGSSQETLGTDLYGSIQLRLKPEVKRRTSITIGDSLDEIAPTLSEAAPLLNPQKRLSEGSVEIKLEKGDSTAIETKLSGGGRPSRHSYIEAQIFGGVSVSDIDSIFFSATFAEKNAWLISKLQSQGIEVNIG